MCEPDCSVESVFEPIASSIPPQKHTQAYPPTPGTTEQNNTTAPALAWPLSLLLLFDVSQGGTLLDPPASSIEDIFCQQRLRLR